MASDSRELDDFKGVARLFPLPNLVLFPTMLQGLHIFEPRYRQMTADALADDHLLTTVLLQPGWEAHYQGNPAIHRVGCLAKIIAEQRLDDGRYNLQVRGLSRVRISRELLNGKLYRSAQVELLHDIANHSAATEKALRRKLAQRLPAWNTLQGTMQNVLLKVVQCSLPLGLVCDILSFALPLTVPVKQELLDKVDVERRARALLRILETDPPKPQETAERGFPPDFSMN